jgi:cobaltochelatase CobN
MWSGENAKTGGVNEALVLHLLGARVERNWRGEVTGVVLIPRAELGRPRVDVIVQTSGVYRDHFQDKVALMNDAAQLAAAADEPDNPVAIATREAEAALLAKGETPERAAALARARVFAPAAGAYSPSIQFLAKSGDLRGDEARMADLYTMRMSHAYGGGLYGAEARAGFEANLRRMDGAALSRSSDVNGMLDHPMSAGFLGGLNLAAKKLTGRETMLYVTNQRDMRNVSVQSARSALQTELRTRYFNREWLRENQAHGYDGARTFMLATDHLDLWDTTATKMVESSDWAEVKAVFVDDKLGLDMDRFFDRANPFAQQVLLTNLLGAAKRGHWEASEAELAQIARRLVSSVRDHGPACEASQCRNQKMTDFVQRQLTAQPGGAALINVYKSAIASATADQSAPGAGDARQPGAPSSAQNAASADRSKASATPRPPTISQSPHSPNSVTGQIMREIEKVAANAPQLSPSTLAALLIALLALMGFGGWLAGRRSNT